MYIMVERIIHTHIYMIWLVEHCDVYPNLLYGIHIGRYIHVTIYDMTLILICVDTYHIAYHDKYCGMYCGSYNVIYDNMDYDSCVMICRWADVLYVTILVTMCDTIYVSMLVYMMIYGTIPP